MEGQLGTSRHGDVPFDVVVVVECSVAGGKGRAGPLLLEVRVHHHHLEGGAMSLLSTSLTRPDSREREREGGREGGEGNEDCRGVREGGRKGGRKREKVAPVPTLILSSVLRGTCSDTCRLTSVGRVFLTWKVCV